MRLLSCRVNSGINEAPIVQLLAADQHVMHSVGQLQEPQPICFRLQLLNWFLPWMVSKTGIITVQTAVPICAVQPNVTDSKLNPLSAMDTETRHVELAAGAAAGPQILLSKRASTR
jgi:hypothetical protein